MLKNKSKEKLSSSRSRFLTEGFEEILSYFYEKIFVDQVKLYFKKYKS